MKQPHVTVPVLVHTPAFAVLRQCGSLICRSADAVFANGHSGSNAADFLHPHHSGGGGGGGGDGGGSGGSGDGMGWVIGGAVVAALLFLNLSVRTPFCCCCIVPIVSACDAITLLRCLHGHGAGRRRHCMAQAAQVKHTVAGAARHSPHSSCLGTRPSRPLSATSEAARRCVLRAATTAQVNALVHPPDPAARGGRAEWL